MPNESAPPAGRAPAPRPAPVTQPGREDATIRLCGPCRHFEQALTGAHACGLGLPVLDGEAHTSCRSFSPFAQGEGSLYFGGDCCKGHAGGSH